MVVNSDVGQLVLGVGPLGHCLDHVPGDPQRRNCYHERHLLKNIKQRMQLD